MEILIILIYIILLIVVTSMGSNRKIGGGAAFILSFLLTPLIGLIFVALSDKKEEGKGKVVAIKNNGEFVDAFEKYLLDGIIYVKKDKMGEAYEVYKKNKKGSDELLKESTDYMECKNFMREAVKK